MEKYRLKSKSNIYILKSKIFLYTPVVENGNYAAKSYCSRQV